MIETLQYACEVILWVGAVIALAGAVLMMAGMMALGLRYIWDDWNHRHDR